MELIKKMMTNNPCYKAGRTIAVKGLMLHSVGCPQPSAMAFINSMNSPTYTRACVHGFIDANTGAVYQTLPWNHRGWHGGSGAKGSANNTMIGIEMCEPSQIKYTSGASITATDLAAARASVTRTYNSAVELFAYLCKLYNLNPMTDIVSHREGYTKGIATCHVDPSHLWDGLNMGYTMDKFRAAVKSKMNGTYVPEKTEELTMTQYEELKASISTLTATIKAQTETIEKQNEYITELRKRCGYYNYIDSNMPEYAKETVKKLKSKGILQGNENGELQLTTDLMRTLVIMDRCNMFD